VTANRATDAEYHFYPCAKHVATRMQAEVPNSYCSRIGKRSVQIGWQLFRWFRNSGRRVNKEQEVHERAIFPARLQPRTRSLRAAGQKKSLFLISLCPNAIVCWLSMRSFLISNWCGSGRPQTHQLMEDHRFTTRLRIWGSGVRISSGAPSIFFTCRRFSERPKMRPD
jgi:hypothetical protein